MPTHYSGAFWNQDPRRWEACRQAASTQMIADGWNKHARKFGDVQRRKALKLWANGGN